MVRAIDKDQFKALKPSAWTMIKNDYGFFSSDDDQEPDNNYNNDTVDVPGPSIEPSPTSSNGKNHTNIINELKKELNNLKEYSIKSLFRCLICYETKPNCYLSCYFCGRYLGCYSCVIKLKKCPLCYKTFQCEVCTADLPRKPQFIPLIEEQLGLEKINRENAVSTAAAAATNDNNNDDDSDFDLPAAFPANNSTTNE